jgi:flagella basal body P-ring formation protein FlgA
MFRSTPSRRPPALAACLALAFTLALCASTAAARQDIAPLEAAARQLIDAQTQNLPGVVTVELAPPSLETANRLAPCPAPAAFLPGNTRAWGSFNVGVRCENPPWTMWLKARVTVNAAYLVAARPLAAGQLIGPDDFERREGDITRFADDLITLPDQAIGRSVRYPLARNKPLQARMLRAPSAIQQGNDVTVINRGAGFQVTNIGRALNDAAPGEIVRVRLAGGQIVSGIAHSDGTVRMGE